MTLSVREMCMLSAAAGWVLAWGCAWIFKWWPPNVRAMGYEELRQLLGEIRREIIERGGFGMGSADEAQHLQRKIDDDLQ